MDCRVANSLQIKTAKMQILKLLSYLCIGIGHLVSGVYAVLFLIGGVPDLTAYNEMSMLENGMLFWQIGLVGFVIGGVLFTHNRDVQAFAAACLSVSLLPTGILMILMGDYPIGVVMVLVSFLCWYIMYRLLRYRKSEQVSA